MKMVYPSKWRKREAEKKEKRSDVIVERKLVIKTEEEIAEDDGE